MHNAYILHLFTIPESKVACHFRVKRCEWQGKTGLAIAIDMHKP